MMFHRVWVRLPNSAWPISMEAIQAPSETTLPSTAHETWALSLSPQTPTFTSIKPDSSTKVNCYKITRILVYPFVRVSINLGELHPGNRYKQWQVVHPQMNKWRSEVLQLAPILISLIFFFLQVLLMQWNQQSHFWFLSMFFWIWIYLQHQMSTYPLTLCSTKFLRGRFWCLTAKLHYLEPSLGTPP